MHQKYPKVPSPVNPTPSYHDLTLSRKSLIRTILKRKLWGFRTHPRSFMRHHSNYFTSSDPHHDMLGGGCQVRVVRKTSKPGMLFFTIFACSCRVLSATQNSTCQKCSSKQDTTICQNMSVYHLAERNMPKHATTNMPNHVRIPPVKNI